MTRDRTGRVIGSVLLNIAALGGLVCIVLVVLSMVFNVTLIMFKTGSMSPTIPTGSLAVVREIPASEIEVGNVLTVERPGMLPVTHRVTSVAGSGDSRTITMKGDANDAEDPAPYTVTQARIVMMSVPELAKVVVWFSNPWVLGGLTVGASVLVTWAFWPRRAKDPRPPRHGTESGEGYDPDQGPAPDRNLVSEPTSELVSEPSSELVSEPSSEPGARTGRVAATGAAALCALVLGFTGAVLPHSAPAAEAARSTAVTPVVTRGEHITLTSLGDADAMRTMRAGVPVPWQVGVSVDANDPGAVQVSLESAGSRELGLTIDVRSCSVEWSSGTCAGVERRVGPQGVVDVGAAAAPVTALRSTEEVWLLVTATVPEPAAGQVALTIRAVGSGDDLSTSPGPLTTLPVTGAPQVWMLAVGGVAAGLIAAGVATALRGRQKEAQR